MTRNRLIVEDYLMIFSFLKSGLRKGIFRGLTTSKIIDLVSVDCRLSKGNFTTDNIENAVRRIMKHMHFQQSLKKQAKAKATRKPKPSQSAKNKTPRPAKGATFTQSNVIMVGI